MNGYHSQPERTTEAIRDGWLDTGDYGRIDEDGFVYLVDRKKEIVRPHLPTPVLLYQQAFIVVVMRSLKVEDLSVRYATERGPLLAVDEVSFDIEAGEMYGLVGESGAGKSTVGRAIMRMIEDPGSITGGRVVYGDRDVLSVPESEMRTIRGSEISMIFQDPQAALNPVLTVGQQLRRVLRSHAEESYSKAEETEQIIDALERVDIPDPESRLDSYPVEFSGGMSQRVMIAMALISDPAILIADEPTSNLDVTIEANILDLLENLQEREDLTILLITHNMGVVAHHCDRIGVMYAGKLVEEGDVMDVFERPGHPYTRDLVGCVPRPDRAGRGQLPTIEGTMPTPVDLPDACYFAPRCSFADEQCWKDAPGIETVLDDPTHRSACYFREEVTNVEDNA